MNCIRIDLSDAILSVELNRPESSNAFNDEMIRELKSVFSSASQDYPHARVLILKGTGKNFCAGADLKWMSRAKNLSPTDNIEDADRLFEMYLAIKDCPLPVVTYVHGYVYAGGIGLCAASDIVIAQKETTFCLSEAAVGLVPVLMSPFIIQKMGFSRALELTLTGRKFSAEEAERSGLVHFIADETGFAGTGQRVIQFLLKSGPNAIAQTKKLYDQMTLTPWRSSQPFLSETLASLRVGPEAQEGIQAFLEKRRAQWTILKSKI